MKNSAPSYTGPGIIRGIYSIFLCCLFIAVVQQKYQIPFFSTLAYALALLDFLIHESGHFLFGFDGKFLAVLGGTITQLLFPSIVMASAIRRARLYPSVFFGFWIGQSLTRISPYIADARAQALPLFTPIMLFGGKSITHDWNFLLGKMNLLWADQILGTLVYLFGIVIMLGAILCPILPLNILWITLKNLWKSIASWG
jgi:hypothetical protein